MTKDKDLVPSFERARSLPFVIMLQMSVLEQGRNETADTPACSFSVDYNSLHHDIAACGIETDLRGDWARYSRHIKQGLLHAMKRAAAPCFHNQNRAILSP